MLRILNPADNSLIKEVPEDNSETVTEKYKQAREAQREWAATALKHRIDCMQRFRGLLADRLESLSRTLTQEVGKPIKQSRSELNGFVNRVDFFVDNVAHSVKHEAIVTTGDTHEWITHEPLGVISHVSSWSYPYYISGNSVIPALLTGNAVLFKPSEYATLSGMAMSALLHLAGIPKEILQLIIGGGSVGADVVRLPVDGIFFTGSYATGKKIAESVAGRMIKLQLELGGKDSVYVCDDIDVGKAAASLADGAFYNNGQSCSSVERIYVHKRIHDRFVDAFVGEVENYKIGSPTSESTFLGPLTRSAQIGLLEQQVADARSKGAKLLLGGHRVEGPGNYYAPTVLTHVNHSMEVMRDESFGPIIGVQKARDDDEAAELMNDTEYGLTAGVYTADQKRAEHILAQMRAGTVYWNCCDRVSARLPWSGIGHSGLGVTLSSYGIQTFCRPKAWHLRAP